MRSDPGLTRERDVACEAAAAAADLIRAHGRTLGHVNRKAGSDIVTDVDLASERIVVDTLARAFPDDAILSEEAGSTSGASRRCWVVDPLDGTVNFAAGIDYFAVSIGLERLGEAVLGVVHDPSRAQVFSACRGVAARCNDAPCAGPAACEIRDAVVALQLPDPLWRGRPDLVALTHEARGVRVSGSVALDLCWVASGRFDLMVYRRTRSRWDWLAAEVIVEQSPNCTLRSLGRLGEFELVAAGRPELIEAWCSIEAPG